MIPSNTILPCNMSKYVKLIARPNTWFKEGTEVLWQDSDFTERRPTRHEWQEILDEGWGSVFFGIRVCEDNPNERKLGYSPGDERFDGEACDTSEFDAIYVDEDKREL